MSCKLTSSLPFLQYVTIRVHIRCQGNGYRIMISSMFSSLATQHVGIFKQQATTCTHKLTCTYQTVLTHDYFCIRHHTMFMKCYPESDKTVYVFFYPHCLSLLRLISSRTLPPSSSLPLSPSFFSIYETMGGTFPSHPYLLRRVTSRHISIFIISYTDFKVSACFSERWGSATRKPAQIAKHEVLPWDKISI